MCKIVRSEKLKCPIFMKSIKRKRKKKVKKVSVLHYIIDIYIDIFKKLVLICLHNEIVN